MRLFHTKIISPSFQIPSLRFPNISKGISYLPEKVIASATRLTEYPRRFYHQLFGNSDFNAKKWVKFSKSEDPVVQTRTLDYYQRRAEQLIAGAQSTIARNQAITGAYAALFFRDSDFFFWPGMAAYASRHVGLGILATELSTFYAASSHKDAFFTGKEKLKELATFQAESDFIEIIKMLSTLTHEERQTLHRLLIAGNNAVYADLFPLFLAYLEGGYELIQSFPIADDLKKGFLFFDLSQWYKSQGQNDKALEAAWHGNQALLQYEQQVTLQKAVYNEHPDLWQKLSAFMFIRLELGWIPDKDNWSYFRHTVPEGNVGAYAARWSWIVGDMSKKWYKLSTQHTDQKRKEALFMIKKGAQAKGSPYHI